MLVLTIACSSSCSMTHSDFFLFSGCIRWQRRRSGRAAAGSSDGSPAPLIRPQSAHRWAYQERHFADSRSMSWARWEPNAAVRGCLGFNEHCIRNVATNKLGMAHLIIFDFLDCNKTFNCSGRQCRCRSTLHSTFTVSSRQRMRASSLGSWQHYRRWAPIERLRH